MNETPTERTDRDDRRRSGVAGKPTHTRLSRRRVIRGGSLVGLGSVLGIAGSGIDRAAAAVDGTAAESNRPDAILRFEYGQYEHWEDIYRLARGERDNLQIVSSPTYDGETALQLRIREGDRWGASAQYHFDDGLCELNGRVALALNTNWTIEDRTRCQLWNCAAAVDEGCAENGAAGMPGWSNRLYVTRLGTAPAGPFQLMAVTDHRDCRHDQDVLRRTNPYAVQQPAIIPGQWYDFEYYVRVNTIADGVANHDGVVQYWLDGELIYERCDLRFTATETTTRIEANGPAGYYGGSDGAPRNLYAYYATHSMALNGTFGNESWSSRSR